MARTPGVRIPRAWWYSHCKDHVHFMIESDTQAEEHIHVPADSKLGQFIKRELESVGYEGPRSEAV